MRLGGPEALDFFQSVQKANYHFADPTSVSPNDFRTKNAT